MYRTDILALMLLLSLGAATALSQGMYISVNGGYGLGAGTQTIGTNSTSVGTSFSEPVHGSFGEGFKLGASAGYLFTDYLGAELGFSYWFGKPLGYTTRTPYTAFSTTWSGWGIVAVPSLVLTAGMKPVNPYARLGLVVGLLRLSEDWGQTVSTTTTEGLREETGKISLGYAGALGVSVPAGGGIELYVEAVLHSITFSPSKYEYTKYTVNGVDQLSSVQPNLVDFKDTFTGADQHVLLGVRRPFSSVGFAIGARVNL